MTDQKLHQKAAKKSEDYPNWGLFVFVFDDIFKFQSLKLSKKETNLVSINMSILSFKRRNHGQKMNFGSHHQRSTARPSTEGRGVLLRVGLRGFAYPASGQRAGLELQIDIGMTATTRNQAMATNTTERP
jgi:hypothetical protein